ncbi:phosphoenolpyruvate hydrolase family protein [Anaerobutyricum hallii]|nr:phosphoenolpyruvate hydrolase family protein [Anaerobutyricum hallii]
MLRKSREEILKDFKAQVAQGKILVGVGAGTGITAKCSEKADVDMLIIYNSGRFRMAGRGSLSGILSYGDANAIVQEMGQEVLPIVKKNSSTCRCMWYRPIPCNGYFLKTVKRAGI